MVNPNYMDDITQQQNIPQPTDGPINWEEKTQEYLNNWKRAEANMANYQKDEQKRIADMLKFGNEAILMQAIVVVDGLERALQHAPESTDKKWLEGIQQVEKQFQDLLKKYGVEKIKAAGRKFDPLYHEVISGEGDMVGEEAQSGYILHGKVIRPARVILSK